MNCFMIAAGEFAAVPGPGRRLPNTYTSMPCFPASLPRGIFVAEKCRCLRINLHESNDRPYGLSCSSEVPIPLYLLHFPSLASPSRPTLRDNDSQCSPGVPAMGATVRQFPNSGGITHWLRRKCDTAGTKSRLSWKNHEQGSMDSTRSRTVVCQKVARRSSAVVRAAAKRCSRWNFSSAAPPNSTSLAFS